MADFNGSIDDDDIIGSGNSDTFTYFGGDDVYTGGQGDDIFNASGVDIPDGGSLTAIGGAGEDALRFSAFVETDLTFRGGAGNDTAHIVFGDQNSQFNLNLGDGNDSVFIGQTSTGTDFTVSGEFNVTLGQGQDRLVIGELQAGSVIISDFEVGDLGDAIEINVLNLITNWDASANLFATGHFSLDQDGNDTLLSIDFDGSGSEAARDIIRFTDVDASELTAANFSGLSPDGSPVIGEAVNGTESNDTLLGTFGSDTIDGLGVMILSRAAREPTRLMGVRVMILSRAAWEPTRLMEVRVTIG